jgi:hypothetical protein
MMKEPVSLRYFQAKITRTGNFFTDSQRYNNIRACFAGVLDKEESEKSQKITKMISF